MENHGTGPDTELVMKNVEMISKRINQRLAKKVVETMSKFFTLDRLGDEVIKTLNQNLLVVCYVTCNECRESRVKNPESHNVRCGCVGRFSSHHSKSSGMSTGYYGSP